MPSQRLGHDSCVQMCSQEKYAESRWNIVVQIKNAFESSLEGVSITPPSESHPEDFKEKYKAWKSEENGKISVHFTFKHLLLVWNVVKENFEKKAKVMSSEHQAMIPSFLEDLHQDLCAVEIKLEPVSCLRVAFDIAKFWT